MRRSRVSSRARSHFVTDQNVPISGYLTMVSSDGEMGYPLRYFVSGPNSPVKVGQAVTSPQGETFLLGAHTHKGAEVSYRAIPTHDELTWGRMQEVIDPVTRMKRDSTLQSLGTLRTTLIPMGDEKDGLKIPNARFLFYTAEAVELGDTVNGMNVTSITPSIGLKRVVLD